MHPAFPHHIKIPRPNTRAEHKAWLEQWTKMGAWCHANVNLWGTDDDLMLFVFEDDLKRFKEHFGLI